MKKLTKNLEVLQGILSRREIKISLVLSFLVGLPSFFIRPFADDVFMLYLPEHFAGSHPMWILFRVIEEIPGYIQLGVFRPLSRLIFYTENWAVLRLSVFNGISPFVVKAGVRMIVLLFLLTSISLFIRQASEKMGMDHKKKNPGLFVEQFGILFPILFSSLFILRYPGQNPVVLFPTLYLFSACIVFLTPYLVARKSNEDQGCCRKYCLFAFGLLGAAIASMIEITYVAIPVAAIYGFVLYLNGDFSNLKKFNLVSFLKDRTIQNILAISIGFIAVFAPARFAIHSACSVKECYQAASIQLDTDVIGLTGTRMVAPILSYTDSATRAIEAKLKHNQAEELSILIMVLIIYFLSGKYLLSHKTISPDEKGRGLFHIFIPVFTAILFASTIAGLSASLQTKSVHFASWRDSAITWPATAILLTLIFIFMIQKISSRALLTVFFIVFSLIPIPTLITNYRSIGKINQTDDTRIHISLANNLVYFDTSESGNTERCNIIRELRNIVRDDESRSVANEILNYITTASMNFYNKPYCDDDQKNSINKSL